MYVLTSCTNRLVRAGSILLLGFTSGCGVFTTPQALDSLRPQLNLSTLGIGSESTHFETSANDQFELAEFVLLSSEGRVIRGMIDDPSDVDLYNLGQVRSGDRIVVDMTTIAGLDAAIALFDETGTSLLVNDHRNVYLHTATPFIDVVIEHDSAACYVAVTNTPGFTSSGEYALLARRIPNVELPALNPDVVLLMFDGGENVRIGGRAPLEVPIFDAATISEDYEGLSEAMMAKIVSAVREDFEGLDVTILSTSEGAIYQLGMTRIYFGQFDAALLGVAEGVDEFNATNNQRAIVFTDTFRAFNRLSPTVEEMGQALANVTSHEIGHLLGLIHTRFASGIMDVTASLKSLMQNQVFSRSPIYEGVFPVGSQNSLIYMLDAVGGDEGFVLAKLEAKRPHSRFSAIRDDDDQEDETPARAQWRFSGCCLKDNLHQ